MMPDEAWRQIAGYPRYYISDHGRVISQTLSRSRLLKPDVMRYRGRPAALRVGLRQNGATEKIMVHRLVLEAFVGPCPPGMQCRHLDGDPTNNRVGNLRWGTAQENQADSARHGTARPPQPRCGEANHSAILTAAQVAEIRRRYAAGGVTQAQLGREFGARQDWVSRIVRGQGWAHG
jgi:hypothetical protein